MSNVDAIERLLEQLGGDVADSPEAASARTLAQGLDGPNSLTSKAMASKAFNDALDRLRAMAPEAKQEDRVDEIAKRRERRLQAAG